MSNREKEDIREFLSNIYRLNLECNTLLQSIDLIELSVAIKIFEVQQKSFELFKDLTFMLHV